MIVRMAIIVFLVFACLMLVSPIIMAFPIVSVGQHVGVDPSPGSCITQANLVRPNDPGSGGGGTGVIR